MAKRGRGRPEKNIKIWNRDEFFDPRKDWKKIETDYFERPFIVPTKAVFDKQRQIRKNLREAHYRDFVKPKMEDADLQDKLDFLTVIYAWLFCAYLIYAVLTHKW